MADDGGDGGGYLDPRGDTPVGSTWATGNLSPNDPLVDWASNLRQDDLARFVNDPDGHAQAMAQAGIPPPSDDAMDRMHQHNETAGTPSRSMFGSTGPVGYTPQQQAQRAQQEQQAQNIVGGVPRPNVLAFSGDPGGSFGSEDVPGSASPGEVAGKVAPYVTPAPITPQRVPAAQPPVVVKPTPAQMGQPSAEGGPPQAAPVPTPKPRPHASGEDLNPPEDQGEEKPKKGDSDTKADGTPADTSTPQGQRKVENALSTLAKTMQGVKAPEPLKPPSGYAPAPRGPLAAGAVSPAALMAALGRTQTGQVPASVMPVLRALGRG